MHKTSQQSITCTNFTLCIKDLASPCLLQNHSWVLHILEVTIQVKSKPCSVLNGAWPASFQHHFQMAGILRAAAERPWHGPGGRLCWRRLGASCQGDVFSHWTWSPLIRMSNNSAGLSFLKEVMPFAQSRISRQETSVTQSPKSWWEEGHGARVAFNFILIFYLFFLSPCPSIHACSLATSETYSLTFPCHLPFCGQLTNPSKPHTCPLLPTSFLLPA